jgi:iron complex outermembrane recepter protein
VKYNSLRMALLLGCSIAAVAFIPSVYAQTSAPGAASEELVVTANRREQAAQKVAVSVTAFSAETLRKQNVTSTIDLARLTPGVVFSGSGSDTNTTFFIRGAGRDVIGPISPSVGSYINDVVMPSVAAVIPSYDMSSIQVLKGPQGTLFGRNTTGGAVLTYSKEPTYEFGGYLQGLVGSYNWKEVEGAINIPLVADKLAVRVAAQSKSRDGYTKGGNGIVAGDNLDSNSYRVSVLFEPTSWIKNVTVFDHYEDHNVAAFHVNALAGPVSTLSVGEVPAIFAGLGFPVSPTAFTCGTSPSCDVSLALARQQAAGRGVYWSRNPNVTDKVQGVSNTTTLNLGSVDVKNIFGFRSDRLLDNGDSDGTEMSLVDVDAFFANDQLTDELQLSGDVLGKSLHWLVGGFILEDVPGGPNALRFNLLRPDGVPVDSWPLDNVQNAQYAQRSHAVFAALTQDMGFLLPGLKFNASARYTWDSSKSCSVTTVPYSGPPLHDFDACVSSGAPGLFIGSTRSKAPTWSIGADYQATDKLFFYAVTRRGYRAGSLNSPRLGGLLTPYQTFAPQTLTDVEIGMKSDWDIGTWRSRFNISTYYGKYDNLQRGATSLAPNLDGDGDPNDDPSNTSLDINSGTATVKGVELDGFVSPTPSFRLTYGGSWFDGEISDTPPAIFINNMPTGKQFDNAPKWSYTVGAQYNLPFQLIGGDPSVNVDWYWQDHYKVVIEPFPSHHILNVRLNLDNIQGKPLSAQFFIQNVTNEFYYLNANLSGLSPGVLTSSYGPPRMFGFRLRYDFAG